jgi:hypothetical protein
MPKPVLSDSLFNADDVATAVLAEANLQVTNSDLGVTDVSSNLVLQTGWQSHFQSPIAYKFNGFVFVCISIYHYGGTPANGEVCIQISDSNLYPNQQFTFPTIAYEDDSANSITVTTNGAFEVNSPTNHGNNNHHVSINGFYRL